MTRFFALAELVCFPLSLLTILALLASAGLRVGGVDLPTWWTRFAMPLLAAGAVGYLTNYIAVRMLFEPYSREGWHWLRLLTLGMWRQGLIPARKNDLAGAVGKEVSDRLLTPRAIADEFNRVVSAALDDQDFRRKLPQMVGPLLREGIPVAMAKLGPELTAMVRDGVAAGLTGDNVKALVRDVVLPWVGSEANRGPLVDGMVAFIGGQSPRLVGFMKERVYRLRESNQLAGMAINFAESSGMLDWDEIARSIVTEVGSETGRAEVAKGIDKLTASLGDAFDRAGGGASLDGLRGHAADFAAKMVADTLAAKLPEVAGRFIDSPVFWDWAADHGIPALKPRLSAWLDEHGHELVGKRFDVAGRVQSAVVAMDTASMHAMVDNVATEQLGAIQVLGYFLGLATGVPLVFLL